jgi:predicted metalloprotease with PDZ domain
MKKIELVVLLMITGICCAAQKISYVVSFPNLVHHEAEISVTVSGNTQKALIFRMSRSSPGRYATHEFGKNVYNVKAFDKDGKQIVVTRTDGDVYQVSQAGAFVQLRYTLYANHPDGTYAGIDQDGIHLNMPASFIWVKGMDAVPIDIKFDLPQEKNWTIATQLKPGNDPGLFTAPGLQYFMDAPVKIGDLKVREWTIRNPDNKTYRFRFALESAGSDTLVSSFASRVQKITEEAKEIFGETPSYDYNTYTFLTSIHPYIKGDGMEHRNSTVIHYPVVFDGGAYLLEVFAHEFFHCWNVERIRPRTLEPFNFEKSNMSNELWFAEGFTQYYGDLIVKRAGFSKLDDFLQTLSSLVNTKENTQGAKISSPVEVSRHAVFVDAGVSIDRNNYINMYTSYYPYGAAIAMALDLSLRVNFKNITLDDYMKAVWNRFGKKEIPYTVAGLEEVLKQVTGDSKFSSDFFAKYINAHESFNYAPLLEKAGLVLGKANGGKAWMGNVQYKEGTTLSIASNTVKETPLYEAGLEFEDQILQLDGKTVKKTTDIADILKQHKPGDKISIEYKHRDNTKNTTITLGESPAYAVTTNENANRPVAEEQLAFRKRWLE